MITSNLLENDPELIDLIDKFMGRLPALQSAINDAHENNDEDKFSELIHQIKGVGGNYGYPDLTTVCATIESHIKNNDVDSIKLSMGDFNQLVAEIISGHKENHEIVRKSGN